MKKVISGFVIVLGMTVVSIFLTSNIRIDYPESEKVYLEVDSDIEELDGEEYRDFYLLFDEINLNTRNFVNYFGDIKFERMIIYPYLSILYYDKLDDYIESYEFSNDDVVSGVNGMYEKYKATLEELSLFGEVDKIEASGIRVRMVMISCSVDSMKKFLNENNDVKYCLRKNGIYKKIK